MKTKLQLVITSLLILFSVASGKCQSGIYANITDYKNNKLSYEANCNKSKRPYIHLHDFFGNTPVVTVKKNGKKHCFKKNELYGYRDCDNTVYRFYKNGTYTIAEASGIYIYTQTQNIAQSKGFIVVNVCYFSSSAEGEIIPLTMDNLRNAYRNNDKFLDLLDESFSHSAINDYDNIRKTFKVNYLYAKSIKQ